MNALNSSLLRFEGGLAPLLAELSAQVQRLSAAVGASDADLRHISRVSAWSAAGHLEHLMITGRTGYFLLEEAAAAAPPATTFALHPDAQRLFALRGFPRGEIAAPEFSHPTGLELSRLRRGLERYKRQIEALEIRGPELEQARGVSLHPVLGPFSVWNWLVFIAIHQNHHLGILEEIRLSVLATDEHG